MHAPTLSQSERLLHSFAAALLGRMLSAAALELLSSRGRLQRRRRPGLLVINYRCEYDRRRTNEKALQEKEKEIGVELGRMRDLIQL